MSGECVHRFDPRPHIELPVHYLDSLYALQQPSPQGSICLVADAQYCALLSLDVLHQVMEHPSSGAHSTGRDDYMRFLQLIYRL